MPQTIRARRILVELQNDDSYHLEPILADRPKGWQPDQSTCRLLFLMTNYT